MFSNLYIPDTSGGYNRFGRGRNKFDEDTQMSDSDARSLSPSGRKPGLQKILASSKARKSTTGNEISGSVKSGYKLASRDAHAGFSVNEKRSRPLTQHQIAVQEHRRKRTQREIDKMIVKADRKKRRIRYREGPIVRCWRRIKGLKDVFAKSDDEVDLHHIGETEDDDEDRKKKDKPAKKHLYNNGTNYKLPAGLAMLSEGEDEDWGEESMAYAAALRRARRRLARWEEEERIAKKKGSMPEDKGPEVVVDAPQEDGEADAEKRERERGDDGGDEEGEEDEEDEGDDSSADDEVDLEEEEDEEEEGVFQDAEENGEEEEEDQDATEDEDREEEDGDVDEMDIEEYGDAKE